MRIRLGQEYDVIESATVITHDDKDVSFKIDELTIRFIFKVDKSNEDTSLSSEIVDNKTLNLILTNYNNPLGQGLLRPVELGSYNGDRLLISFMIYSLNDTGAKTIHVTFLSRKKLPNNEQKEPKQ